MDSLILRTASSLIMPLQLAFSLILLIRGHNEPGGGFIGGLVAACGVALHGFAHGIPAARRLLRVPAKMLIGTGLLIAMFSGLPALFQKLPFMTAFWDEPAASKVTGNLTFGTPLLFELGVYLVVTGIAVHLIFTMSEEP